MKPMKTKQKLKTGWLAALLASAIAANATGGDPAVPARAENPAPETREAFDARMAWWREARFGMFIHWGVYAVPAGIYRGEEVVGGDTRGEWIMSRCEIPVAEYKAFAKEFNPIHYDPEAWARLAKEAGMRYIVLTAKHHDGFALWPTKASDWNVAEATPYGKDLIGPLAKASRDHGLHFGLYYSQAIDWTQGGATKDPIEGKGYWDPSQKGNFDQYIDRIAVPQVKELMAAYQPEVIWWDTPRWMNEQRSAKLNAVLRPGIIHNNRLGGGFGDYGTAENRVPTTVIPGDWEACMTINNTWGFKKNDDKWKSSQTLIRTLVKIVSNGGNFLLNVGPGADGTIPQASIDRLHEIGRWMKMNGEAIYGTTASPFRRLRWGRCTKKSRSDGTTLYLHVFDWPQDGDLGSVRYFNIP